MVNEIIKGVAMKLGAAFGYRIYQDDVRQGMKTPCFFVSLVEGSITPLPGGRYIYSHPLDVRYVPEDGSGNRDMAVMAMELVTLLEYITLPGGNMLRGTSMRFETVDDVLHFFVSYNLTMIRPTGGTPMEELGVEVGVEKGWLDG